MPLSHPIPAYFPSSDWVSCCQRLPLGDFVASGLALLLRQASTHVWKHGVTHFQICLYRVYGMYVLYTCVYLYTLKRIVYKQYINHDVTVVYIQYIRHYHMYQEKRLKLRLFCLLRCEPVSVKNLGHRPGIHLHPRTMCHLGSENVGRLN